MGNWGLIHADLTGKTEDYHLTKKYYALANYSKFFKPGFRILDCEESNVLAAIDEDGQKLVILLHNSSTENVTYSFDLTSFQAIGKTATPYRTSQTENLVLLNKVNLVDQNLTITAISHSITTYVIFDAVI
jgi:O-glycosyl hydrolase